MSEKKRGQCLCGAVTFTAEPKLPEVGVCHCKTCRTHGAGPFFGIDCGAALVLDDEGQIAVYQSSPYAERGFCKTCGTVLFWRMQDRSLNIVNVEAFGEPGELVLDHEVYIDKKPSWYDLAGERPRMTEAEVIAAFIAGGGNP